jgi:hypothetical protein
VSPHAWWEQPGPGQRGCGWAHPELVDAHSKAAGAWVWHRPTSGALPHRAPTIATVDGAKLADFPRSSSGRGAKQRETACGQATARIGVRV